MTTQKIIMKPVDALIPYANNARTHSSTQIDKLCASLREFGFVNPVLVDGQDGIIAGHGRVMAAKKAGMISVPTLLIDNLTDAQKRAYILADNKLALDAGWDESLLRLEMLDLQQLGYDIGLSGFDSAEIDALLADIEDESPGLTDKDAAPDPPENQTSIPGDLWLLGKHRLLCGDATSAADMQRLMGGGIADMLCTDPPYNVDYKGKAGKIKNDNLSKNGFADLLKKSLSNMAGVLRPGGSVYVAHADSGEIGVQFRRAFIDAGLHLSACLIWKKSHFVLGRADYQFIHEPILYGWKDDGRHSFFGGRKQTTIQDCDYFPVVKISDSEWQLAVGDDVLKISGENVCIELLASSLFMVKKPLVSEKHPTMKPVELFERFIRNSSKRGATILDGFGGSGTTLISSHITNRCCYMMELDPKYIDVIVMRWQEFTGIPAIHGDTGKTFADISGERLGVQ